MEHTPSGPLTIRPATSDDQDVVYAFLCDLEDETLNRPRFDACFACNLANPMVHYLIAELPDGPVGFVSCHIQYLLHHTGKVGEIQELFVKPAYRSQQIGRQLVNALVALARQEELVNLEVTTNQKRNDAIRFYERESFIATHQKLVRIIN
ncbi:GNAT family N-acetyltransferase [Spirosoma sp. KUDC1026]|uniref:GNAT family N-acetyltransferase n=1 Tax=Spirosoma sp. KUDC1026 TaxID=2745947 RepID=UPI00159BE479|nr:GNAT family N-acetyltransferase [Spirosoma sp. KUDC1026]QKZ12455.1 GNAT family N-acetyltransferase [Spirosoma sp. KUDC1026]